ncbi:Fes1-domain-containing protein [Xylariaceae sp. FL0804]|nr:Fes1-domain-containing protein [Xylariaceae sp. FL0804]
MASDKNLNELLKWSIEAQSKDGADGAQPRTTLNPDALAQVMGAPSDAELMQARMGLIASSDPGVDVEARLAAFDDLEQLVESLDNANLLAPLGLWTPLLEQLGGGSAPGSGDDPRLRLMAAWCVGTAVQNNAASQERLLALGGVERLVALALGRRSDAERRAGVDADGEEGKRVNGQQQQKQGGREEEEEEPADVRRKAVYALSSAVRNYQPAMDAAAAELARRGAPLPDGGKVDASDMDAVDAVIRGLKERIPSTA